MADSGWIKLQRDIIDSPFFSDCEVLKLWIYLVCRASYTRRDVIFAGNLISLQEGELICGRKELAHKLNIGESKIYRSLKLIEKAGKIKLSPTNKYTVISLIDWDSVQGVSSRKSSNELQDNINCTSNEHNKRKYKKERKEECFELLKNDFSPNELEEISWQRTSERIGG